MQTIDLGEQIKGTALYVGASYISSVDGSAYTSTALDQSEIVILPDGDAGSGTAGVTTSNATPAFVSDGNGQLSYQLTSTDTNHDGGCTITIWPAGAFPVVFRVNLVAKLSTLALTDIEADTQDLQAQVGTDGAGLTNIPWNSAWDAEVQSEVEDALNTYDPPTNAEMEARTLPAADYFDPDSDIVAHVTLVDTCTTNTDMVNIAGLAEKTDLPTHFADLAITETTGFVTAGTVGDKTGYSLTAGTGLGNQAADITGNISGSVGSVTAGVTLSDGAITAPKIANGALTDAKFASVEGSRTFFQSLRLIMSAVLGKAAGNDRTKKENTVEFYAANGNTKRITAEVDIHGNRTTVTINEADDV